MHQFKDSGKKGVVNHLGAKIKDRKF
jgi:hypothetical protein